MMPKQQGVCGGWFRSIICRAMQDSAIADFPQRMAALQEEHTVQQQLYQAARKESIKAAKALSQKKEQLKEQEGHAASLSETIEELQAQMQGAVWTCSLYVSLCC